MFINDNSKDGYVANVAANGGLDVNILGGDVGVVTRDLVISANNPLPTDDDSIYVSDIKSDLTVQGTFTGDISSLFNNLDDSITSTGVTNPKYFEIYLERPFRSGSIALVAKTGNFSNVKVIYKDRQGAVLNTMNDSTNNTKYTSHRYDIVPLSVNVCCIRVEFHTADTVTLSFLYLRKIHTVRASLTGTRDDGTRGDCILDDENKLIVLSQPYSYGVSRGSLSGRTPLLKFGTRTAVAANTQSIIWEGTNALYTYLTSAEQLKVTSSSGSDVADGTGARTLTLVGLDANWLELTETITLTGGTAVTTTGSFIRIFRAYVATCGTGYTNAGNITITNNAGTNQLVYIPAGDGQTLMTIWTVPAGKVFNLLQGTVSTDTNKGGRVAFYTRLNDGGILYPWQIKYRAYIFQGNYPFLFNIPFRVPAKTDIEVRIITPAAAGTTSCGATFEGWYENV